MGSLLGWIGNALLLGGSLLAGRRWKHAFGLIAAGDAIWVYEGLMVERADLWLMCVLFGSIALWNWKVWCADSSSNGEARLPDAQAGQPSRPRLLDEVASYPSATSGEDAGVRDLRASSY